MLTRPRYSVLRLCEGELDALRRRLTIDIWRGVCTLVIHLLLLFCYRDIIGERVPGLKRGLVAPRPRTRRATILLPATQIAQRTSYI